MTFGRIKMDDFNISMNQIIKNNCHYTIFQSTNRFLFRNCFRHFFSCSPTGKAFSFEEQRQKIHPCLDGGEEFAYNVPKNVKT